MTFKTAGKLLMLFSSVAYPVVAVAESPYVDPGTAMEFVLVKGGCFAMGDAAGEGDPSERPVHESCVDDFYMGKYEVTNEQYKKFDATHNSGTSDGLSLDGAKQPVVNVSWENSVAFARWLSEKSKQNYRLPTEAEWEYAARAGSMESRFWGNNPDEACKYANVADLTAKKQRPNWTVFFCDDGHVVATPVGSFKANGLGLHDMLGNVWEWCADVYSSEAYGRLPQDNPLYRGLGEYKVMRGGGWSNGPLGIRSSHRVGLSPDFGHHALGFRLVKTAK
ncbi:MAG TPA: formylglycine-generating enzyme family protein [Desulfobulbaceae bacterium]|nr:formylglycine-generating enzyme family protein [Desulfobulbaceae bacterium]